MIFNKYCIWPLDGAKYYRKFLWYYAPSRGQMQYFPFNLNGRNTWTVIPDDRMKSLFPDSFPPVPSSFSVEFCWPGWCQQCHISVLLLVHLSQLLAFPAINQFIPKYYIREHNPGILLDVHAQTKASAECTDSLHHPVANMQV